MKNMALIVLFSFCLKGCSGNKEEILDFPHTRQSFDYSCGPGVVQAVMAYYGEDFRESQLIDSLKTNKDDGTYVGEMVRFLKLRGYQTELKQHMTKKELFGYIDRDIPVIALIQAWGKDDDFAKQYKDCWNDGHFVVVIGYTDKDVLCSDPALFTFGYIPIGEFWERWHDYDEGDSRTWQMGLAVWGKKPTFALNNLERIK